MPKPKHRPERESAKRFTPFPPAGYPDSRPASSQRQNTPSSPRSGRNRRLGIAAVVVWLLLLVLPVLAILRLSRLFDFQYLLGALLLVSAITLGLYRGDKNRAMSGRWRTSESTLHLAELAGGWIVAYLVQRAIRHKISKRGYQIFFWLIIFIHQYAALDYLKDWQHSRFLLNFVTRHF